MSDRSGRLRESRRFSAQMNARILESGNLDVTRFSAPGSGACEPAALDPKTKELLGPVASLVLCCDGRRAGAMLDEVQAP